jgi:hypothetical protein
MKSCRARFCTVELVHPKCLLELVLFNRPRARARCMDVEDESQIMSSLWYTCCGTDKLYIAYCKLLLCFLNSIEEIRYKTSRLGEIAPFYAY